MRVILALIALLGQAAPEPIRLPCTADTMISMSAGEEFQNGGARSTLRLKGIEDVALLDFDVAAIRGRRVEEARLFFTIVGPHRLRSIGISSVGTPWKEGRGASEPAKPGEPCYREAARGERPWGRAGGDLHDVTFSRGGSIWFVRDLRSEADGWSSVEIPPAVLHAMLEGNSFGLCLSDERAQTMSNNSIYSREQSGRSPYIAVLRSQPGVPPASGARKYGPPPPRKSADRSGEFLRTSTLPAASEPARLADGCRFRILYEGETNPAAAPAARLWNGRSLSLEAARGEHVAFEIALQIPEGETRSVSIEGAGWSASRVLPVGPSYDPLVPAAGDVSGTALFYVERYIPKNAATGELKLAIGLKTGKASISVPVSLRVRSPLLPDALSFHVSLNAYGVPGDVAGDAVGSPGYLEMERAYHRLAHEHRATLAIVPYTQRGWVHPGLTPEVKRDKSRIDLISWKAYDERLGPYFDGSAFKGLPREGIPIDHFYWPLHENWPLALNEYYGYRGKAEDHWRDAPAPELAFPDEYGKAFAAMVHEFGAHAAAKGWTRTMFQVFLNNKPDIRFHRKEPEGAWWRLDEPVSLEDHLAIRYFALRTRNALKEVKGVPIVFRADLSRPQWRRDTLDGLLGLDVISGIYRQYPEHVFGRGEAVWVYGGVPGPGGSGEAARAWVLQVFLDGADGVVPWNALGSSHAWETPEDVALLLPPRKGMEKRPYATLRLKGLRRGQQDVEILRLLLVKMRASREEIRAGVSETLGLQGSFRKADEVDAGTIDFGRLDPDRFEAFRRSMLAGLEVP